MDQLNVSGGGNPQGTAFYGTAQHGPDLHTLSALLDGGSTPGIAQGDGNLGHDAYGSHASMDVGYGNPVPSENEAAQGENVDAKRPQLKTLPFVLAKYVRAQNKPVTEEELCEEVQKCYKELRKPDGTRYTGNLERAVRGSLCSTGLFEKLNDGTWSLKEEQTRQYERRLMDRATKEEAEKSKKRKARDESVGNEGGDRPRKYSRRGTTGTRSKRQHKREAIIEMVTQFSDSLRTQPNWAQCFTNPFKGLKGDECGDDVWKKLGNERFIFMLQIYTYLRDLITNRHAITEAQARERLQQKQERANSRRRVNEEKNSGKREGINLTHNQMTTIGKKVNNLHDNIIKLNNRLGGVEEILGGGSWGSLDQRTT